MLSFASQVDDLVAHSRVADAARSGKLVRVVGLTLEAKGIMAPLGAHCQVENVDFDSFVDAEVVGFAADTLYLMPFDDPGGLAPGAKVWVRSNHSKAGPETKVRKSALHRFKILPLKTLFCF